MVCPRPHPGRPQGIAAQGSSACRSAWQSRSGEFPISKAIPPGSARFERPDISPPLPCHSAARWRQDANPARRVSPARETSVRRDRILPAQLQSFAFASPHLRRDSVVARTAWLRQNAMMSSKTQTLAIASPSSQSMIFYLLCGGFVVNGIVISFIGPVLPMFMAKWGLNDSRAGLFSLVQFSGSFVGVLTASVLMSAKGFKPAITLGIALLALGFALLNAPTFTLALAASAIYGLGYGFATPGTNLWVGESYGERRASALNIMNLAWGIGAISSSPLAMLTMRTSLVTPLLYLVAAICATLALVLFRMSFGKPPHQEESVPAAKKADSAGNGVAVLLGVLFFVYVGTEVGTSYWAPSHAQRAAAWSSNTWALAPMFFFAGLLGGRGVAAAILLHLKEVTVAVGGLLLAATG